MNILIVEDDKVQSTLIQKYLKSKTPSWAIYDAKDGVEALETIEVVNIDLILLDMSLPRLGGIELIKNMHSNGKKIPFIAISGGLNEKLIQKLYANGALDCIKKPFFLDELYNKVQRVA